MIFDVSVRLSRRSCCVHHTRRCTAMRRCWQLQPLGTGGGVDTAVMLHRRAHPPPTTPTRSVVPPAKTPDLGRWWQGEFWATVLSP